jgi:Spy/CpxP family protein refolding chaperone
MSRLRLAFWVLGIFLIGAFTGGVTAYEYQRHSINMIIEGGPKAFGKYIGKKMAEKLKLDDSQRPAFEAIMAEVHEGIRGVHQQAKPQIEEIFEQARPKILALLRPDQQEIFERMVARHKERQKNLPGEPGSPQPTP